ncbi:unnamed protein product [Amoebophrya sp. A25]|nr:unnamed protein product [Amoebophrya sp. A25]|eukprot:GSA25T00025403001.1
MFAAMSTSAVPEHLQPAPSSFFGCYLLNSESQPRRSYVGFTVDPRKRIRQHNGEILGGARRTQRGDGRPWRMVLVVWGFPNKVAALQFEWAWQNPHLSRSAKEAIEGSKLSWDAHVVDTKLYPPTLLKRLNPARTTRRRPFLSNEEHIEVMRLLLRAEPYRRMALNVHFLHAHAQSRVPSQLFRLQELIGRLQPQHSAPTTSASGASSEHHAPGVGALGSTSSSRDLTSGPTRTSLALPNHNVTAEVAIAPHGLRGKLTLQQFIAIGSEDNNKSAVVDRDRVPLPQHMRLTKGSMEDLEQEVHNKINGPRNGEPGASSACAFCGDNVAQAVGLVQEVQEQEESSASRPAGVFDSTIPAWKGRPISCLNCGAVFHLRCLAEHFLQNGTTSGEEQLVPSRPASCTRCGHSFMWTELLRTCPREEEESEGEEDLENYEVLDVDDLEDDGA